MCVCELQISFFKHFSTSSWYLRFRFSNANYMQFFLSNPRKNQDDQSCAILIGDNCKCQPESGKLFLRQLLSINRTFQKTVLLLKKRLFFNTRLIMANNLIFSLSCSLLSRQVSKVRNSTFCTCLVWMRGEMASLKLWRCQTRLEVNF